MPPSIADLMRCQSDEKEITERMFPGVYVGSRKITILPVFKSILQNQREV